LNHEDRGTPGTPDGDRLAALAAVVEEYEAQHFPLTRSA
jgi:hypothetical protein